MPKEIERKNEKEEKIEAADSENQKSRIILGGSQHIKDLLKWIKFVVKEISQKSPKTEGKGKGITKDTGPARANILILGPRGTGKELVAREIWDRISAIKYPPMPVDSTSKKRNDKNNPNQKKVPFVAVNCAAIATDLFESEMFGHVKWAFTGAGKDKEGKVEAADGGILFLDEIGDLSLNHQAKLLRFLEEREYTRVGEIVIRKVNTIIIAATNKLDLNVPSQDFFRDDIYDRLAQYINRTIALRQRYEDVVFYVNHFGKEKTDFLTKCLLYSYYYPGNVRELKNLVGKNYNTVKREIRERFAREMQELGISTDANFTPEKDLFWKPGFGKLINQRSDAIDSLMATFQLPKKTSNKLEKWVKFYEIVTLWFYSTLSREDLAKSLTLARGKLTSPEFENTFEETFDYTLPEERDVQQIDIDDDFAGLPRKAMKFFPDFMEFFNFDLDE